MVDFLSKCHPVRGLDKTSSAKQCLRRGASQNSIDDGKEIDLFSGLEMGIIALAMATIIC